MKLKESVPAVTEATVMRFVAGLMVKSTCSGGGATGLPLRRMTTEPVGSAGVSRSGSSTRAPLKA